MVGAPDARVLVDRVARGAVRREALTRLPSLRLVEIAPSDAANLEMIGVGAVSPLTGFMVQADYRRVLDDMRLVDGSLWSLPITLPVRTEVANSIRLDEDIALFSEHVLAIMRVAELFTYDKRHEAERVYQTSDPTHPGVARLLAQGEVLVGGEIWLLNKPADQSHAHYRLTPAQTRRRLAERGWSRVAGLPVSGANHSDQDYPTTAAIAGFDGVLFQISVGQVAGGDPSDEARIRTYRRLIREYYSPELSLLGIVPGGPRHASPREMIFQALCRRNYGCSHFLVGQDFDDLRLGDLGIELLRVERSSLKRAKQLLPSTDGNGHGHSSPSGRGLGVSERTPKLMVIGLDCAPPEYVFELWRERLPNLRRLMDRGLWGELRSSVPPITVPAWACMLSGKDPGTLGVYGFRNRADYSYDKLVTANARSITEDRVWDVLSRAGKKVVTIAVPQTYPPKPVNGVMVGCFLTPSIDSPFTYPPELKDEIASVVGEYVLDVHDFRTEDKQRILDQIWDMTAKRFALARHLLQTREWDFFMLHEIGPDRIHHSFWKYMDPRHPKHEPGNAYQNAIPDYYERLDAEIGRLLALAGDDTVVMVVSDHGARMMEGGICLNEWLMNEGYLHLAEQPSGIVPIERCTIDWPRTTAWGSGGYYGRVFLNVRNREQHGTIEPSEYERVRDEIAARVAAITDPYGRNLGSRAYKPQDVYERVKGVPPDLIVYFGDLAWRAVGSVGYGGAIHTFDNDTGPDDANHAEQGVFIMSSPPNGRSGKIEGLQLMDIAPTVLSHFGLPVPADMQGAVIG